LNASALARLRALGRPTTGALTSVAPPQVTATVVGNGVRIDGPPARSFGHRIPRSHGPDDGIFAAWAWDGQTLKANTDRYGFQPLYWRGDDRSVAVSPTTLSLAGVGGNVELDHEALAVFVRLGFFIGEDTAFRGVSAMPPGGRLEWRAGQLAVHEARPQVHTQQIARLKAIDQYIECFRVAMARRPPPAAGCVVPLSGGRDSRQILLELLAVGHRPQRCITARSVWPRDDEDARVAAELGARLGVPVHVVAQTPLDAATELRKNLLTGFGATSTAGSWPWQTTSDPGPAASMTASAGTPCRPYCSYGGAGWSCSMPVASRSWPACSARPERPAFGPSHRRRRSGACRWLRPSRA
jgi:asparagine synthase (glutamine-hydrolysing)